MIGFLAKTLLWFHEIVSDTFNPIANIALSYICLYELLFGLSNSKEICEQIAAYVCLWLDNAGKQVSQLSLSHLILISC